MTEPLKFELLICRFLIIEICQTDKYTFGDNFDTQLFAGF